MSKFRVTLNILAVAIFTMTVVSIAQAQATRTWVSGVGDDVNPCSRTAPCKTYAGAISKTAKDGEISTLDPGGFGAVTITKSITINGGGQGQGYGSILASGTNAVIVNITDAADLRKTVRLNWLDINGAPSSTPGLTGIRALSFNRLQVENTIIDSFRSTSVGFGHGIHVNNAINNSQVTLRNVTVRNCLNSGIRLEGTGANILTFALNDVHSTGNAIGFDAANGSRGSVHHSMFSNNTSHGVNLSEAAAGTAVNMVDCVISVNGGNGINVVGSSRARIARCFIAQNTGNSLTPAAQVDSGGNNSITGNGTNTAPGGTPFPQN